MLLKPTGIYSGAIGGPPPPVTTEARLLEDGLEERITESGETRQTETAAPVGFSPTDIANNQWFSDPLTSTLTFSSGNIVQQIDDESGNGRDFLQLTVAKQPILDVVNGRTELTFDGVDDALQWTGPVIPVNGPWTLFFACRHITRPSTGNVWWTGGDSVDRPEDTGIQGRGEGLLPNPAWAIRMFSNNVLAPAINLTLQHGTDLGPPHWVIFRSDGIQPSRVITVENDLGGSATVVTTADPLPMNAMVIGERMDEFGGLIGQNANIGFYAGGLYSQHVIGQDLSDLKSWLADRIV